MKITKSRACLMAYIVSLAIVVLLSCFIENEQINRIAFATTIAGLFFALSDYFSFVANDKKESVENIKKRIIYIKAYLDATNFALSSNAEEAQRFLNYFGKDCEVSKNAIAILEEAKKLKLETNEFNTEISECEQDLIKEKNEALKKEEVSNWLLCMGFAFALVIVFLKINITDITNISNIMTIISFGIITLTYLLKDVGEEKRKVEMDKIKETENYFNSINKRISENKELVFKIKQLLDEYEIKNNNADS
ncbi:MAG: hypothetical protein IJ945_02055 [Oscillospiraceae bacterium]|nr:hypothetical protein [Oscillospiraceae bacterium]